MVMEVLKDKKQIQESRKTMIKNHTSIIDGYPKRTLRSVLARLGVVGDEIAIGDYIKSWDVLRTLDFLENNVGKKEHILDIGCFASEILLSSYKADFRELSGVDLNSELDRMESYGCIQYQQSNFMETTYPNETFKAITSISVIEHGYDKERLIKEMTRLLAPGGYFIASFDYWQDKIDTSGIKIFGLDWLIFSEQDVLDLIEYAAEYGMTPVNQLDFSVKDKVIKWGGKAYTFGWLVLQKNTES